MVFVIAEIGMNHDGSFGQAKAFIRAAADCGVNAVKFQTHIFDAESLSDAPNPTYFKDETRKEYFERTAFSVEQWLGLKKYAEEECDVEFISSPFSCEAVDVLEKIKVKTYKIPSGEVSNIPFLLKVAKTHKRILLSSGMSTWTELDAAVSTVLKNGCNELVLLQCTSEYPCQAENTGLNLIPEMKNRYNLPIGFSDHTRSLAIPIVAIALGATVIEKHFTLSRRMYGPDAKNSIIPEEFKALVDGIRDVEKALATSLDKDAVAEKLREMKMVFEKSIVASSRLPKGIILEGKHLAYKKPGDGIHSRFYMDIIGKRLKRSVEKDYKFKWEDFEN